MYEITSCASSTSYSCACCINFLLLGCVHGVSYMCISDFAIPCCFCFSFKLIVINSFLICISVCRCSVNLVLECTNIGLSSGNYAIIGFSSASTWVLFGFCISQFSRNICLLGIFLYFESSIVKFHESCFFCSCLVKLSFLNYNVSLQCFNFIRSCIN